MKEEVSSLMNDISRLLFFSTDLKNSWEAFKTIRPDPQLIAYLERTWVGEHALYPAWMWHPKSQAQQFQKEIEVWTNNRVEGYSCVTATAHSVTGAGITCERCWFLA